MSAHYPDCDLYNGGPACTCPWVESLGRGSHEGPAAT